jgi:hypothetical protein
VACRCHGEGCETAGVALPLPKVESPNGEGHLKVMQANEPVQANRESPSGERCQSCGPLAFQPMGEGR